MSLFQLGQIVATPGAVAALEAHALPASDLLARHAVGDWGELDTDDFFANVVALLRGERLLSSYTVGHATKVWIITEADRSVTTLLLPEEY